MNKISKIMLIILLFNLFFIVNVFATNSENLTVNEVIENAETINSSGYEYVGIEEVTYINPLYRDVIDESDLNAPSNVMTLSDSEDFTTIEEMGKQVRNELKKRTETIVVNYITDTKLDNTIFKIISDEALKHTGVPTEGDYMAWQYAGWRASATGNVSSGTYYYTLTYTYTYYTTYEQEKEMDVAVSNLLSTLNLSGTDYEKITSIYDYICKNITYDNTSDGSLKHTAYAALINKTAVCQGYAVLFYRLALENNIDVRLISGLGNGGAHGWNIVKIGNAYYNVDATWDATYAQNNQPYKYYMLTDTNFTGHTRDANYSTDEFYLNYPMGTTNYTAEMNEEEKNNSKLNGLILEEKTGYYSYYENGNINTKFTGLYEQDGQIWYVISGKVDLTYNGIYTDSTGTYVIKNNKVDKDCTKVEKIDGIWRMVINGKVNYQYTGIGTNENGTWYVEDGRVTLDFTGTYTDKTGTYIIEKSQVQTDCTEVMKIDGIWRMVINGKVDYQYTGIGTNDKGTWYVENGTVNFGYTGTYYEENTAYIIESGEVKYICNKNTTEVIKISGIWRMVINGKINYQYTGIGSNSLGTWYVENGTVKFNYTGTYTDETGTYIIEKSQVRTDCTEVIKINGIWRMVINGKINYQYTGIGSNNLGTWYVENGTVNFGYTGTYYEENTAYIIENGEVKGICKKDTPEVIKINGIWRMVIDGKVDYQYTGLGTNQNGTWYVENGRVTLNYTGTYTDETGTYIIEKSQVKTDCTEVIKINGIWRMVINGKIYYEYTGIGKNDKGTWYVENGTVNFGYTGTYYEENTAYIIESGEVKGICKKDTPEVIKIDGIWRMVINGKVEYDYTGIGSNSLGTWYVENGKVTFNYTGTYTDETGTYIIEKSQVRTDYTKVMRIDGTWRMIINGKVEYEYTGIGSNEYGTWYVENGTVNFGYTGTYYEENTAYIIESGEVKGICKKDTPEVIKINGIWRMAIDGKVDYQYTGLGSNSLGTWYVENGKVTFDYTGTYTDETGTYIIEESKVRTDYTKVMRIDGTWRMIINGKVDYEYTGIGKNDKGTWYVENGTVNFGYTGTYYEENIAYIIESGEVKYICSKNTTEVIKINGIWRMVIDGKVDYQYTGLGTNQNGTWYVENGTVTLDYTGTYTDETGTYIIEESKVRTDYTKVMRIDGTWRMIINGKVDYEYTGIGSNEYGTWYVENGKVTFEYTGTYYEGDKAFIIEKSQVMIIVNKNTTDVIKINETWRMVLNGKVDYSYEGIGTNSKGMWILQNGEVNFNYTGQYTDSDGSIYNIVKGEVREVISRAGHPGTMWVDQPIKNSKHITGSLDVSGWALTEETGDIIQIYLDNKYVGNASRNERDDVFEVYKNNEYGGIEFTPLPGYYYKLNTAGLSKGTHIVKIVNLASDGKTIIQSREVAFTITNLTKTWGIDVSKYQGDIDWNSVKNSGVEFAILRIGYYIQSKNQIVLDEYFNTYYNECKRLGIAVGGYFYSYAFNSAEAAQEASVCLSLISGKSFEMPIFLDVEDNILKNAVANGSTNVSELTNASVTFCDMMNNAGYKGGVYASKNFFNTYLNTAVLEKYNIWLAHYTTETDYTGKFDMWQYTSDGSVPGINGPVDLDWCFSRYF